VQSFFFCHLPPTTDSVDQLFDQSNRKNKKSPGVTTEQTSNKINLLRLLEAVPASRDLSTQTLLNNNLKPTSHQSLYPPST